MVYRKNSGKSLDDLEKEIARLNAELKKADRSADRWARAKGHARMAFALVIIGAVLFFSIRWKLNDWAEIEKHNQAAEDTVFKGARSWVKLYNNGKGEPFCYVTAAIKEGNGRIPDTTIRCNVRVQDKKDTILIDCSPNNARCYRAKVQCKAVR
jgi:hypothetical protein